MEDIVNCFVGVVKKQRTPYNNYSSGRGFLFVYNRLSLYNAVNSGRLAGEVANETAQQ